MNRSGSTRNLSRIRPKQDEGLSLLVSLMMGMMLIAGATGLLHRQMIARKLGAAESYQQMAETAALNGFNRILGELNNDDYTNYKGYLLTLDHHGGDIDSSGSEKWGWNASSQGDFPLREICTNRNPMPEAVPATSSIGEPPYIALTPATSSQRDDGKANIQLLYRLRGYTTTATANNNGSGEGRFQVEGLVVRHGDDASKGYLARTLLLRSLYVRSIVAGEGDWAVLAGQTLSLGDTNIEGDGKVLLNVNSADPYLSTDGCTVNNLLDDVGTTNTELGDRIVPILNQGLPTTSLWNLGLTQDKASGSDNIRIWSFDDTAALTSCASVVCSREIDSADAEERDDLVNNADSVIRLSEGELCQGTGGDCHIYVEHINLTKTQLLIETKPTRPVVLRLEYPNSSTMPSSEPGITGSINLESGAKLCGVTAGEDSCNGQAQQLIIMSGVPKPDGVRSCAVSPSTDKYVLAFDGDSLPAATVHLRPGIVKTGSSSTNLTGLIWADGICTDAGPFELKSSTIIDDLNEQWKWDDLGFPGYGQMVSRGIRGTGLDTFRRW